MAWQSQPYFLIILRSVAEKSVVLDSLHSLEQYMYNTHMNFLERLRPVSKKEMRKYYATRESHPEGIWPFRTALFAVQSRVRPKVDYDGYLYMGRHTSREAAIKHYIRTQKNGTLK